MRAVLTARRIPPNHKFDGTVSRGSVYCRSSQYGDAYWHHLHHPVRAGILNWPSRQNNGVYRLLGFLLSPVNKAVRFITPVKVANQHVPVVVFTLLFWLYVILIAARLHVKRPGLFQ